MLVYLTFLSALLVYVSAASVPRGTATEVAPAQKTSDQGLDVSQSRQLQVAVNTSNPWINAKELTLSYGVFFSSDAALNKSGNLPGLCTFHSADFPFASVN